MSELIAKAIVCGAVAVMPGTVIAFFLTPVFMRFRQMISASMKRRGSKAFSCWHPFLPPSYLPSECCSGNV